MECGTSSVSTKQCQNILKHQIFISFRWYSPALSSVSISMNDDNDEEDNLCQSIKLRREPLHQRIKYAISALSPMIMIFINQERQCQSIKLVLEPLHQGMKYTISALSPMIMIFINQESNVSQSSRSVSLFIKE